MRVRLKSCSGGWLNAIYSIASYAYSASASGLKCLINIKLTAETGVISTARISRTIPLALPHQTSPFPVQLPPQLFLRRQHQLVTAGKQLFATIQHRGANHRRLGAAANQRLQQRLRCCKKVRRKGVWAYARLFSSCAIALTNGMKSRCMAGLLSSR